MLPLVKKRSSSWLVIPHHPLLEGGGLSSLLVKIFNRWAISLAKEGECTDDLRASIAWSLGGLSLKSRLTNLN